MSFKAIARLLASAGNLSRYVLPVLLALASWWLAERYGPAFEKGVKLEPGKVDYYAKQLQRTVMDETGQPKELLVADELVHYDGDDRTEIARPVMNLFVKDGPPWIIHAESATLPGKSDEILLHGDVLVTREANRQGRTMRIETTNARVQPDKNYAETDEDIRVISPPDYMTGTGARFNFGDGIQYSILANVRRRHDVQE